MLLEIPRNQDTWVDIKYKQAPNVSDFHTLADQSKEKQSSIFSTSFFFYFVINYTTNPCNWWAHCLCYILLKINKTTGTQKAGKH